MNIGYKCQNCGSYQSDAYLTKSKLEYDKSIYFNVVCRKCKTEENINITSWGIEGFDPPTNEELKEK